MKKVWLSSGCGWVFVILSLFCARDTDPPEVKITSPTDDDTVSGIVTIEAEVNDASPVLSVSFFVDSVEIVKDTVEPWECEWNTLDWADSSRHTIQVGAIDKFENEGTSQPIKVTVVCPPDTEPPEVKITSPTDGDTVKGVVLIKADVSDASPVIKALFLVDSVEIAKDTIEPWEYEWSSQVWADSNEHAIQASAIDTFGNEGISPPVKVTVVMVNSPPSTPKEPWGEYGGLPGATLSFFSTTTDREGDEISFQFAWNADTSAWTPYVQSGDTVSVERTFPVEDTYYVKVRAKDTYGDTSDWSPEVVVVIVSIGQPKWRYDAGSNVQCAPAIGTDGTIYFSGWEGFYALGSDGSLKWKAKDVSMELSCPAPLIGPDGTIYLSSFADGSLYAFTPSGGLLWEYQTKGSVYSSPAIALDGTLYFGSDDSCLYALTPEGSLKWKYKVSGAIRSSPAIGSDGTIYFGSIDSCLYALAPDSTLKWKVKVEDNVWSSPALGSDGTIYFTYRGSLCAYSPAGVLLWSYPTWYRLFYASPVIGPDGTIYFGARDDYLHAINPSGSLKWQYKTGGNVEFTPAVGSDGTIYVGASDGYLYAIDSQGTIKWGCRTGKNVKSSPAIGSDGTVYFGSDDGYFYAVTSESQGLASSPWPKFHHDNCNTGRAGGP